MNHAVPHTSTPHSVPCGISIVTTFHSSEIYAVSSEWDETTDPGWLLLLSSHETTLPDRIDPSTSLLAFTKSSSNYSVREWCFSIQDIEEYLKWTYIRRISLFAVGLVPLISCLWVCIEPWVQISSRLPTSFLIESTSTTCKSSNQHLQVIHSIIHLQLSSYLCPWLRETSWSVEIRQIQTSVHHPNSTGWFTTQIATSPPVFQQCTSPELYFSCLTLTCQKKWDLRLVLGPEYTRLRKRIKLLRVCSGPIHSRLLPNILCIWFFKGDRMVPMRRLWSWSVLSEWQRLKSNPKWISDQPNNDKLAQFITNCESSTYSYMVQVRLTFRRALFFWSSCRATNPVVQRRTVRAVRCWE